MVNKFLKLVFLLITTVAFSQVGHLMQGVGAVNMSMGGAATAQPLDISGAMQWNPASLSVFSGPKLKFDLGMFKGTPTLYSTVPTPNGPFSGETESELGYQPMPALAFAWGKEDSKHTFGISAFGVSGFGVDFPESNTNPINFPQNMGGFGNLKSAYMLLQIGFTWAYEVSDKFSIGFQPVFNYESLELSPNPLASPTATGYPTNESATALGFGGQVGLFYDSQNGFKMGASYKTPQKFSEMDFGNGTKFQMDYPAIYSVGLGYSKGIIDFALDYRYVDYESTEGFEKTGWTQTASIRGFGWQSMSVVSTGLQLKAINKLPLRFGYTYSTNPIQDELTFFSTPATAIIAHAFQFGFSYEFSDAFVFDAVYHYGISDGKTSGELFNPLLISTNNPLGKIPGSEVAYDMNTQLFMIGLQFKLGGKDTDGDGVKDKEDACPEIAGLPEFNGCPDSDGDGIEDAKDACPDEAGLAALNGCPDSDGDGFADKEDLCPNIAGLEQFNGCPDSDGDGVMDSKDDCPNEAGLIENKGCPLADSDGDGVADKHDNCPNIAGSAENYGCLVIPEEVIQKVKELARAIYFKTGKDAFTNETEIRLEKISKILANFTNSKVRVEGHTDSTGSDKVNTKLSQSRADAVRKYFIDNGFPEENMRAIGYGSLNPIGDNKTSKGRQANRRVEIVKDE
ncbi:MAG: OmpA family protein [Flavobacteriaceae bacterium]|nr:OmpA family protein [Flavobacteriaceae bacterium]